MAKAFENKIEILNDPEELNELKHIFSIHKVEKVLKISNEKGYHLPNYEKIVAEKVAKGSGRLFEFTRAEVEASTISKESNFSPAVEIETPKDNEEKNDTKKAKK